MKQKEENCNKERKMLYHKIQKRNGNHSETNNRNSQNTRQENTQVPKALRNNIDKDN